MQQLFSKDIQLLIKATEAEIDMFAVATEELQNSFFRLPDAQIAQIQGICEASESLGGPPEAFDLLKLRGERLHMQLNELRGINGEVVEVAEDVIPYFRVSLGTLAASDTINNQMRKRVIELDFRLRPPKSS